MNTAVLKNDYEFKPFPIIRENIYFLDTEIRGNVNQGKYYYHANIEKCKVLSRNNKYIVTKREGKAFKTVVPIACFYDLCYESYEAALADAVKMYLNYNTDLDNLIFKENGKDNIAITAKKYKGLNRAIFEEIPLFNR